MRILLFIFSFITLHSCSGQPDFSIENKIKINPYLFFAQQDKGYVAVNDKDELLFRVDYDEIEKLEGHKGYYHKVRRGDKYGVIDIFGREIVHTDYEVIEVIGGKRVGQYNLKMKYNGKWGIMEPATQIVLEQFFYDEMGTYGDSDQLLLVKRNGKYGFRDVGYTHHGDRDTKLIYDELENYKAGGSKFTRGEVTGKLVISEKTGYLIEIFPDESGQYPENKWIYPHSDLQIFTENGKKGLRNKKSKKVIVSPTYDNIYSKHSHTEEVFIVQKSDKRGLLDTNGKVVIPIKYKSIYGAPKEKRKSPTLSYGHYQSIFCVETMDQKYGLADYKGNILLPAKYDGITYARENHFIITRDGKMGIFDIESQKFKLDFTYDKISKPSSIVQNGFFISEKDGLQGMVAYDGKVLLKPENPRIVVKSDRIYIIDNNNKIKYLVDASGEKISPTIPDSIKWDFINHHTFKTSKNIKNDKGDYDYYSQYIDERGKPKYPNLECESPQSLHHNYVTCFDNELRKMSLVHKITGEIIIPPKFQSITFLPPFSDVFIAKMDDKYGLIDLEGKIISPIEYDGIYQFPKTGAFQATERGFERYMFQVYKGEYRGIIDYRGKVLLEPNYATAFTPHLMDEYRNFVVVSKDGKKGMAKYGLLEEPSEWFDNIFFRSGKFIVVKEGKEYEASISSGNKVEY
ncbi:MAG: WG repeat-containing protein [Bacteroidota bacterium]